LLDNNIQTVDSFHRRNLTAHVCQSSRSGAAPEWLITITSKYKSTTATVQLTSLGSSIT